MSDDFDVSSIEEEYDEYEEDLETEVEEGDEEEELAELVEIDEELEEESVESEESRKFDKIIHLRQKDENHRTIFVVNDEERVTSEIIQWLEMTEAIGIRASQIEQDAPVFTDVSGYTDPVLMATKEFYDRQNPLILERALQITPTEIEAEHWKVRTMNFPRDLVIESALTNNELEKVHGRIIELAGPEVEKIEKKTSVKKSGIKSPKTKK
jgi:DNA-directed RNA polymerase subunit K/omega